MSTDEKDDDESIDRATLSINKSIHHHPWPWTKKRTFQRNPTDYLFSFFSSLIVFVELTLFARTYRSTKSIYMIRSSFIHCINRRETIHTHTHTKPRMYFLLRFIFSSSSSSSWIHHTKEIQHWFDVYSCVHVVFFNWRVFSLSVILLLMMMFDLCNSAVAIFLSVCVSVFILLLLLLSQLCFSFIHFLSSSSFRSLFFFSFFFNSEIRSARAQNKQK